jgi:hypothetical protein
MDDKIDRLRLWLAFGVVIVGITVVFIVFLVAVLTFQNADKPAEIIPAVLGSVTAAVGTLAGLVAGHTAGSAGKERAERRAAAREQEAAAGRTLAEVLKADKATLLGPGSDEVQAPGPSAQAADEQLVRRHAGLARSLFP